MATINANGHQLERRELPSIPTTAELRAIEAAQASGNKAAKSRRKKQIEAAETQALDEVLTAVVPPKPRGTSRRAKDMAACAADILANDTALANAVGEQTALSKEAADGVDGIIENLARPHSSAVLKRAMQAAAKMGRARRFDLLRIECAFASAVYREQRNEAKARSNETNHDELLRAHRDQSRKDVAAALGVAESTAGRYVSAHALFVRWDWLVAAGQSSVSAMQGFVFGVLSPFARYDVGQGACEFVCPPRAGQDTQPGDPLRRLTADEEKTIRKVVELFTTGKVGEKEAADMLRKAGLKAAGKTAANSQSRAGKGKPGALQAAESAGKGKGKGAPVSVDYAELGKGATLDNATAFVQSWLFAHKGAPEAAILKDRVIGFLKDQAAK